MNVTRGLAWSLVMTLTFAAVGCVRTRSIPRPDTTKLMALVRGYNQSPQPIETAAVQNANELPLAPSDAEEQEAEYKGRIAAALVERNYDVLEQSANDARLRKSRFTGGVWKLYSFYEAVSYPITEEHSSDSDWNLHISTLKAWAAARPESATARIALAETYINYGDRARGTGYANTVSEEGWRLDAERTALAASSLAEAARLKQKCPYWYEVMQHVALAQGWDKSQEKELFEQAIAFEPGFYHFYREHANYLLPKWYGEVGEAGTFADQISNRIGGDEGKFIYFEIASLVRCQCEEDDPNSDNLSWPRIKEGYAALGRLYGYSNLKNNRFAHMAVGADDRNAAQQAFGKIGDDWDHTVWGSSQSFQRAKNWAGGA